jgi:hypothetical protein
MGVDSNLFNSQFMIGAINNPLPVNLVSFTGISKEENANLFWSTASEINNEGFSIERSLDGKYFIEIGFVKGSINSNQIMNYNFTDNKVFLNHKMAYYRLKQLDLDGKFDYSKIISVITGKTPNDQVVVYPNPITDHLFVEIETFENTTSKFVMTDLTGKIVREVSINLNAGFNKFNIEGINDLTNGLYFVTVLSNGKTLYNSKFVKTK